MILEQLFILYNMRADLEQVKGSLEKGNINVKDSFIGLLKERSVERPGTVTMVVRHIFMHYGASKYGPGTGIG